MFPVNSLNVSLCLLIDYTYTLPNIYILYTKEKKSFFAQSKYVLCLIYLNLA